MHNLKKKKVKSQKLQSRADLNRGPFTQETSVHSPGLYAGWRMPRKEIDKVISVTATEYLYQHRSLRRDTKLRFALFKYRDSGKRADLLGIRLLFPSASKLPAWLFSSHYWPRLRLGHDQDVGSKNYRRFFLGLQPDTWKTIGIGCISSFFQHTPCVRWRWSCWGGNWTVFVGKPTSVFGSVYTKTMWKR